MGRRRSLLGPTLDAVVRDESPARLAASLRERLVDLSTTAHRSLIDGSAASAPADVVAALAELRDDVAELLGFTPTSAVPLSDHRRDPPEWDDGRTPEPSGEHDTLRGVLIDISAQLPNRQPPNGDLAEWWQWAHLESLALRRPERDALRGRLQVVAGGEPTDPRIVPAAPVIGVAGWDGEHLEGDAFTALCRARLPAHAGGLADVLGALLAVAEEHPDVRCAHSMYVGEQRAMGRDALADYRDRILSRLPEPADGLDDPVAPLVVDEAIRSLYPWPLPHAGSWWHEQRRRATSLVTRSAGPGDAITVLSEREEAEVPHAVAREADIVYVVDAATSGWWQLCCAFRIGERHQRLRLLRVKR